MYTSSLASGNRAWLIVFFHLLLSLVFIPAHHAAAQSATNQAAVDSVKVGDTFNYSIIVEASSENREIIFPDSSHFGDPISIVNQRRYKVNDFVDSLSYTLQFFGTQSYTIPKLPVRFISKSDTSTLFVPPVPLDFKSTLNADNDSLLPLKPIFNFAINWWPYLAGLFILLVAGYVFYRWYTSRSTPSTEKSHPTFTPQPFRDPLKELADNLQTIRSNKDEWLQQGDFKTFYSELGDILRLYLERVYKIPALESTSRELINDLYEEQAPEPLLDKMKSILREADMVKFARFTPSADQAERIFKEAEQFVDIARHQDRQRIEHLRSQHQQQQEQLKTAHESEETTQTEEVSANV